MKEYIGTLTRDVSLAMRMVDCITGDLVSTTLIPIKAGRRVFRTQKDRAGWVATINAEHPGAASHE